jgi:hypothetical protein
MVDVRFGGALEQRREAGGATVPVAVRHESEVARRRSGGGRRLVLGFPLREAPQRPQDVSIPRAVEAASGADRDAGQRLRGYLHG